MAGLGVIGTPDRVRAQIEAAVADCGADEAMIVGFIHDHAERLRSFELIAAAFAADGRARAPGA
jgi:alkanesulfonate monooxygenase SsuD/methylene tetrahydromethanopterin reductase-like flavin-dependent oxidoreductase (luciferase family)